MLLKLIKFYRFWTILNFKREICFNVRKKKVNPFNFGNLLNFSFSLPKKGKFQYKYFYDYSYGIILDILEYLEYLSIETSRIIKSIASTSLDEMQCNLAAFCFRILGLHPRSSNIAFNVNMSLCARRITWSVLNCLEQYSLVPFQ